MNLTTPTCSAPVAIADRHRRQVRLDVGTVGAAAVLLLSDDAAPPAAARPHLDALSEAGLLVRADGGRAPTDPPDPGDGPATAEGPGRREDRLEGWLAELVAVLIAAPVEARVEMFSADDVSEHHLWVDARGLGVLGDHHRDGTVTLTAVPGCLAAASVATLVGLDPARSPMAAESVHVPTQTLLRFHECLRTGDAPGAAAALTHDQNLRTEDLALMLDLVEGRGRSWQVTVGTANLSVVDGGRRGIWRSAADPTLTLTPTTPAELWQRLLVMLPGIASSDITPPGTSPTGTSPSVPTNVQRPPCPPPTTAAPARSCSWTTPTPPANAA